MKKRKDMRPRTERGGSEMEAVKGYYARQHQDVLPPYGQGPTGGVAKQVPWGESPPVPPPAVGAGKGFKGWG